MWDIKSVILYLVMASIGYFCISEERRSIQNGVRRRLKVSYAILFFVWLFLAVYRYVGYESGIIIGGNDAPTYIDYFQTCLAGKGNNIYFVRTEPLFQIMTKAVRTITSNYHVYFALIYGLIIFSYLRFIDEFDLLQSNKTPLFMLVFPFIQSFCAIRTHITIGKRKTSDASNDVLLRFDANSNMLHFRDLAWSELFLFASSFDFRIYNNRLFEKNIEKFSKSILYDS